MNDQWSAQTIIHVIPDLGRLRYYRSGENLFEISDEEPATESVYQRPARGTKAFKMIHRVENIVAKGIKDERGSLNLSDAYDRIANLNLCDREIEGILRLLVARGDFRAKEVGAKKAVKLSLTKTGNTRENHRTYASSFAHEVAIQAEQIGHLIGHGPTVGGEREELLRALIERHVPRRFHVATGFIEGSQRQIDILIYDQTEYAPMFRAGNLVVVPIEAVRALIEVKSSLNRIALEDALQHLREAVGFRTSGPPIFRGVFGYKGAKVSKLISAFEKHLREPTEVDDQAESVFSIYDMADAICVLGKSVIVSDFAKDKWDERVGMRPVIMELDSEAGRNTQAALFFDRLLRFLRHPFEGPLAQPSFASRFAVDVLPTLVQPLYPGRDWGPYMIDQGIGHVEAQINAYQNWLDGEPWLEAPRDDL
jgi:Domain of unknown function (DUF6602)